MIKKLKTMAVMSVPLLLGFSSSAIAANRIKLKTSDALNQVIPVNVPVGHSVTLNFNNDQYIQTIWVDDPALLGVATDRALCATRRASGDCGFASAVRLIQLNGSIVLPGVSYQGIGGRTSLVTITTTDSAGANAEIYQFEIAASGASQASASLISIVPDIVTIERQETRQETAEPSISQRVRSQRPLNISRIREGRAMAIEQGIADLTSEAWQAFEKFIELSKDENFSISEAIVETGVPISLLHELNRMGSAEIAEI